MTNKEIKKAADKLKYNAQNKLSVRQRYLNRIVDKKRNKYYLALEDESCILPTFGGRISNLQTTIN